MIKISRVVEDILLQSPFLTETVSEGVANYSKLARKIQPEVEARLLESVSTSAITMALHRQSTSLPRSNYGARFLKEMKDITVRSNLVEFVFSNSPRLPAVHQQILKTISGDKNFLNISHGLHESIVVVSKEHEKAVADILKKEPGFKKINGLASITLRLPTASLSVPGVYYPVLKVLAWEGINFIEIISVSTELTIIFENSVVDRAFSVLKRLTS